MNEPAHRLANRPLWRWILLALSPSLAYVGFASLSFIFPPLAGLSVFLGVVVVPLFALIVLIALANRFCESRGDSSLRNRVVFVVGFGLLNAMIWFGGCTITARNLDAAVPNKKPRPRPVPDVENKADEEAPATAPE